MSQATAKLLIKAGKEHWIEKREESIDVKGKGSQETYFLKGFTARDSSSGKTGSSTYGGTADTSVLESYCESKEPQLSVQGSKVSIAAVPDRTARLIDWNTEVLSRRIRAVIEQREAQIDPDFKDAELDRDVVAVLRDYVQGIACMYRDNPFHNFAHASHVTLSIEKMLSRVQQNSDFSSGYTNNICSDPLAQFAVVLAAMVHDVDHQGVSNDTLVKEKDPIAIKYHGKSPAENHSLCIAWEVLMQAEYSKLVKTVCGNDQKEVARLKQLLTSAVMATDVFDKDLKDTRNYRWAQVFGNQDVTKDEAHQIDNLKAQIVLEHLIQASDVAHTMQHWHVYVKWNQRLFEEMSNAFHSGHLAKNPAEFWYQGELGFLNHYVIPLAKKLKECKVFGVSCDEFLNYAEANLQEWEIKGKGIVAEFIEQYQAKTAAGNISRK
ncbi:MAG: hypothetical protein SGILL_000032 [Bacillariaceae sp.]